MCVIYSLSVRLSNCSFFSMSANNPCCNVYMCLPYCQSTYYCESLFPRLYMCSSVCAILSLRSVPVPVCVSALVFLSLCRPSCFHPDYIIDYMSASELLNLLLLKAFSISFSLFLFSSSSVSFQLGCLSVSHSCAH